MSALRTWLRADRAATFKRRLDDEVCVSCGFGNTWEMSRTSPTKFGPAAASGYCRSCRDTMELAALMRWTGPAVIRAEGSGYSITPISKRWFDPGTDLEWAEIMPGQRDLEFQALHEMNLKLVKDELLKAFYAGSFLDTIKIVNSYQAMKSLNEEMARRPHLSNFVGMNRE